MATLRLKSLDFRREREKSWKELDQLVTRAEERGLESIGPKQRLRLPVLYRATVPGLSVARAISLDRNLVEYLENLSTRAYCVVYGSRGGLASSIRQFFQARFPRAVRQLTPHVVLAGLTFLLSGVAGFVLTRQVPERFYSFVDEEYAAGRNPATPTEELEAGLYKRSDGAGEVLTEFSSQLFTHNARIGILCFAVGFLAGIWVFVLLFKNGVLLGAFAAIYHDRGLSVDLWGWLLPHGVTELLAVILCAAAGLRVGQGLLFPGRHSRLANLAIAGRQGAVVVIGCVALFLIAGLIEGLFRQTVTNIVVRYGLALATLSFWIFYFGKVGRKEVGDGEAETA